MKNLLCFCWYFWMLCMFASWGDLKAAKLPAREVVTQASLQVNLEEAKKEWGALPKEGNEVEIVLDEAGKGCPMLVAEAIARTETTWWKLITTPEDGSKPIEITNWKHVIHVNPDCRWNSRWLQNVVNHEYGHVLLGEGHSANAASVMYWAVREDGKQEILKEDREKLKSVL